jgi:branched-chain amino acid aminotransferase
VLLTEIRRTASAFFDKMGGEKKDIYIRLNLTRGAGAIGLDIGLADKPTFVILVQYLRERPASIWEKGATLSLAKTLYRNHPKTLNPAWKTANYLNNLLCLREAKSRGADEVVILNLDGAITEAAVSNIFFVSGKEILTPPSSAGILNGVTRQILLDEIAKNWSFDLREENVFAPQLPEFTECFLTSTTQDILPVGKIDNVSYKVGPKTVTRELKTIFRKYVKDYCDRRENLRIF